MVEEILRCVHNWPEKPSSVDQEDLLRRLLHSFLDMLDKGRPDPVIKITATSAPELFYFYQKDTQHLWQQIRELDIRYHVWTVLQARQSHTEDSYEHATLRFVPEKEAMVRFWLHRPAQDSYALAWKTQVERNAGRFEDRGCALHAYIIRMPERGADAVVAAFASLGEELKEPRSLRELSARCFWGDSLFLIKHRELINALYPVKSKNVLARPLLLHVWLPEHFNSMLVVENQDSFLDLVNSRPAGTGLVYGSGLQRAAAPSRDIGKTVFSFLGGSVAVREQFTRWWQKEDRDSTIQCWFWGDLDYAAMTILKGFREAFPDMDVWKPGYIPLFNRLRYGAFRPSFDRTGQQLDPQETGSAYVDQVLLPAIRETRGFVDQEAVLLEELDYSQHS